MRRATDIARRSSPRAALLTLLAALACAVAGCDDATSAPCQGLPNRAVIITVRDSVTGAAAASGAIGTVQTSTFVDSLEMADSVTVFGGSRLGTYQVRIEKDGYQPWTALNVQVTDIGPCGILVPARLEAKLQPIAP
jgi:hypothetical protein